MKYKSFFLTTLKSLTQTLVFLFFLPISWFTSDQKQKRRASGETFHTIDCNNSSVHADEKDEDRSPNIVIASLDAIAKTFKGITWRIASLISDGSITFIYGDSNCGKSYLALYLAYSVAKGLRFFGYRTQQCEVLYVCLEGLSGFKERCFAAQESMGHCSNFRLVHGQFNLTKKQDVECILKASAGTKLIVIDTLNEATPRQDENSSTIASAIKEHFVDYLNEGGSLIIVHHCGKGESGQMRGSSSLLGMADTTILVKKYEHGSTWRTQKMRDGESGCEFAFTLSEQHFSLPNSTPLTNAVVAPCDLSAVKKASKKPSSTKTPVGTNYDLLLPFVTESICPGGTVTDESKAIELCVQELKKHDSQTGKTRKLSDLRTRVKEVLEQLEKQKVIYRMNGMIGNLETH